jgi:dimethylargininase
VVGEFVPPGILSTMTVGRALVRRPSPRLAEGIVTHIGRSEVDVDLASEQWLGYVSTLERNGWPTIEVPAAGDYPDSVFVEDTVVLYGDLAVICRPGAPGRRAETAAVEEAVSALGYRVAHIIAPGTLDGGDVLKLGDPAGASPSAGTVYVGRGGRTNQAGFDQLRGHLEPLGATVTSVPVTEVLHLKSAVTALPDGTVIGYPRFVDDQTVFESFLAVPEEAGSHVVHLGDDRLLISHSAPETATMLARMGYDPVVVDISEFEKLEGCVTCLSVRLRSQP